MICEERKTKLLRSIEKLEAYQEIQNEMGRTVAALNFRQAERIFSHFSSREDIWLEYADEGVFSGRDAVYTVIQELFGGEAQPGQMLDMQLTTPMIEVAGDLQTAKAVWWCPGAGSLVQEGADPQAIWAWGMVAVDFILEDNAWKIWHLHYFRLIKCDYQKGWVEDTSMIHRPNIPVHPLAGPTTYHNPYSPLCVREAIPPCPRAYETYTDDGWMLDKSKL